jgi:ribosomal protein S18 acetylase RimI-like enzyme
MEILQATVTDISPLLLLVNNAYRGDAAKKGWTHEADLIKGEIRIDKNALIKLFSNPNAIILKATNESDTICGCVYLEKKMNNLYLGMLSVLPELQASGIGKKLLTAADDYGKKMNCHSIEMTVISERKELIDWYKRHGYNDSGKRKPFTEDRKFGIPAKHIDFIILEKKIN